MRTFLFLWFVACSPMVYTHGVPNLVQVDPGLYRGGEPTTEGWKYLRSLGIKTVVQLDYDFEATIERPIDFNVHYYAIPPSGISDLLDTPSLAKVFGAVWDMRARRAPVFVHCQHGHDRTGLVVAVYRHVFDGWTKVAAYAEAKRLGFHSALLGLKRAWNWIY